MTIKLQKTLKGDKKMKERNKTKQILVISLAVCLIIVLPMAIWQHSRQSKDIIHQTQKVIIVDNSRQIEYELERRHLGEWFYVWE